ncbi:uncharacterized protein METZ01_LOCUS439253 [marine metagenome]|uniref:Uncharacterized protein n=1 Tax=marine metagenome TaxID=408172 RepID=A0A382YTZ1_9ZZZZ
MILAEFNPMILFILLWGLLSWFTKKKKEQLKEKDQGEYSEMKPKEDIFSRLQKLQDHLSKEVDIFPSAPEPVETGEEYIAEDNEYGFEEPKILETEPEDVHENAGYVFETDIKVSPKGSANWLKQNLSGKSELKKLMVFKEVLGEPRSLKPYTGDYFQS